MKRQEILECIHTQEKKCRWFSRAYHLPFKAIIISRNAVGVLKARVWQQSALLTKVRFIEFMGSDGPIVTLKHFFSFLTSFTLAIVPRDVRIKNKKYKEQPLSCRSSLQTQKKAALLKPVTPPGTVSGQITIRYCMLAFHSGLFGPAPLVVGWLQTVLPLFTKYFPSINSPIITSIHLIHFIFSPLFHFLYLIQLLLHLFPPLFTSRFFFCRYLPFLVSESRSQL